MNRTLDRFRWAVILLVGTLFAVTVATAQGPERPVEAAADGGGYVHWVGEFEPGSDLEHYADWVLDTVGVPADAREERKPHGWEMTYLDMIGLFLTPAEATDAAGLIGQAPLVAGGVAATVAIPEPVETSGPWGGAGVNGTQVIAPNIRRIGVPVDEWTETGRTPSTAGVSVAVMDTGIDARHDDLAGQVAGGFNCSQDARGPDGWGTDLNGHGTFVSGIIGAKFNDAFAFGIAPGVVLYDTTVFSTGSATEFMVLCALNQAIGFGVDVINASLGGMHPATRCGGPSVYTNAWCKAVYGYDIAVVVAAGNDGVDAVNFGPANVAELATVGAIVDFDGLPGELSVGYPGCGFAHRDDHVAVFSNVGTVVDAVAPGGCNLSLFPGNQWGHASGTSFSSPTFAGVMANFMARYPDCRGRNAVKAVLAYADRPEWTDGDGAYEGWPTADAPPMIRYVLPDPEPTTNPDADPCKIPA